MKKFVELFTDGACSGNPGPGGWGAILRYAGKEKELCGGDSQTTNNRMELLAVINGLKALKEPCVVKINGQGITSFVLRVAGMAFNPIKLNVVHIQKV